MMREQDGRKRWGSRFRRSGEQPIDMGTLVTRRPDVRSRVGRSGASTQGTWGPSRPVAPLCGSSLGGAGGGGPRTIATRRPDVRSRFGRSGDHPMDLGTVLTRRPALRAGLSEPGRAQGMDQMGATPRNNAVGANVRGCLCLRSHKPTSYMQRGHRDRTMAFASGIH